MPRATSILVTVLIVTMTVPAATAGAGESGQVLDRVEDGEGRVLTQTRTVPGEPGLRLTEVWAYPEDSGSTPVDQPSDHGNGFRFPTAGDPGTDCEADDHNTWGFRWHQPYTAYTNAHVDLLREAGNTWNLATAANPFGTVVEGEEGQALTQDGVNQILFDDFGETSWLAYAHIWWFILPGDTLAAFESDQAYNTRYDLTTDPSSGGYDIQGIATHEIGHTLGLQHAFDPCLTMYPYIGYASTAERTLGDGDVLGIQGLYGPLPSAG